jgi:hypothetical protein
MTTIASENDDQNRDTETFPNKNVLLNGAKETGTVTTCIWSHFYKGKVL